MGYFVCLFSFENYKSHQFEKSIMEKEFTSYINTYSNGTVITDVGKTNSFAGKNISQLSILNFNHTYRPELYTQA